MQSIHNNSYKNSDFLTESCPGEQAAPDTQVQTDLELVLHLEQATEEVLGLAEDGEEAAGVAVDHDAEDGLLADLTHALELVGD